MTTTVLDLTDLEELVKESAVKMLDGDARKKADVDNPDICWDRSVKCVCLFVCLFNNNNNILYSSQREIKAVVRSNNEEHISIILSHETHAHTHS